MKKRSEFVKEDGGGKRQGVDGPPSPCGMGRISQGKMEDRRVSPDA